MKSEKWRHSSRNSPNYIEIVGHNLASTRNRQEASDQAIRGNSEQLFNLPGDYSVIIDQDGEQIVSCGPSGQFPIYWQQTPEGKVNFSTDIQPSGQTIDPTFLGASIIRATELQLGRTVFEGVNKIEGGETIVFRRGRPIETRGYILPDSSLSLENAAAEFRWALIEAIELRIKLGKVATSDFSGGFDSTALAILLADRLDRGIDTFIQYRPGSFSGDLIFARQIAATNSAIRLHEIEDNEATLPFQGLGTERAHGEPNPWAIILTSTLARLAIAQSYGSQLHLTGEGGDALLNPSWSYLTDMVREGETEHFDKLATIYARMRYLSPAKFKEFVITQSQRTLADDLTQLANQLHQPSADHINLIWINNPGRAPHLLHTSMRRQLAEQATAKALEAGGTSNDALGAGDYRSISGLRESGHIQRHLSMLAHNALNLAVDAPYLDRRVVKSALQLPAYKRADTDNFKKLMKIALKDILPDALLQRNSKGTYSNEMYKGLRKSWEDVTRLIQQDCRLADLGVVEPKAVIEELARLDMGRGDFNGIQEVISAEVWLRAMEEKL